jgi:transposase
VLDKTLHGYWKTTTLIAALGIRSMRCSTVVDGAVNGDVFEAYVEQVLVPQLRPGDIVIMDNLSSHERARIRQLIDDTPYFRRPLDKLAGTIFAMHSGIAFGHVI